MYASKTTRGFYDSSIHVEMPDDVVEITQGEHAALLNGITEGKIIAWDGHGYPYLTDTPPPTAQQAAEQITASLTASVQVHMDEQARAIGYDDIKTAITYADEPAAPRFQAEGLMFREWRSLCWAHCYAVLDAVNAGEREIPTTEELIAELPPLELPA